MLKESRKSNKISSTLSSSKISNKSNIGSSKSKPIAITTTTSKPIAITTTIKSKPSNGSSTATISNTLNDEIFLKKIKLLQLQYFKARYQRLKLLQLHPNPNPNQHNPNPNLQDFNADDHVDSQQVEIVDSQQVEIVDSQQVEIVDSQQVEIVKLMMKFDKIVENINVRIVCFHCICPIHVYRILCFTFTEYSSYCTLYTE